MPNPFVHVELNTTDVAKAKSFYGGLFDWQLEDMPMPELDFGHFLRAHRAGGTRYIRSFSTISRARSSRSFIRPKLPKVRQRPSVFDQ